MVSASLRIAEALEVFTSPLPRFCGRAVLQVHSYLGTLAHDLQLLVTSRAQGARGVGSQDHKQASISR